MNIPIEQITTFDRVRQASRPQVDVLVASIREVGLLNPITVTPTENGFALVAGMHRLEACRALGMTAVPAITLDLDANQRIIAECDENLCASTLTASERAEFTRRRKVAYEAIHGPAKAIGGRASAIAQGREVASANLAGATSEASFTADTAAKTGQSERAIQRDAERGEKVSDDALDMIKGTKLDTGRYLDSIKNLAPEEQIAKVEADLSPPAPVEKLPEPDAVETDPERKKIAKLTPKAMIDDILGLRADLKDERAKTAALTAERDDLKAKLKQATSSDLGRALGNAQRQADTANGRMKEYMAQAKRLEFRLNKAEARVKELEEMEVVIA